MDYAHRALSLRSLSFLLYIGYGQDVALLGELVMQS